MISASLRECLLTLIDEAIENASPDSFTYEDAISDIQEILLDTTCTDGGYFYS